MSTNDGSKFLGIQAMLDAIPSREPTPDEVASDDNATEGLAASIEKYSTPDYNPIPMFGVNGEKDDVNGLNTKESQVVSTSETNVPAMPALISESDECDGTYQHLDIYI